MRVSAKLLSLFLLCCCPVVRAGSVPWLEIKSQHFVVLTDGGERQARHTAGQLERMQTAFAKLLPNATVDPGSRTVVLALRDRKGFQSVEPAAYLAKNALDLAGLYMRGEHTNYILLRLDSTGDHPYATVYHEYTHYMTRHAEFLPVWLSEGLAQFYQNTDFGDHSVKVGQPDSNEILFLREKQLLPLSTLLTVDANSPYYHEEDKGNIFYAESWALTHYLFLGDFGKPESRLHLYARYLQAGESSLVAAQHAFGDLAKLQAALQTYINSGEYQSLSMPLENGVDERQFKLEPVSMTEVDALRADVLARSGRTGEAEALDRAVLAQAPESAQAHESMGMIELQEGHTDQARKWFREAAALHSDDFLTFYYAGALGLRGEPSELAEAATALHECLRLNPAFAPAMVSLSEVEVRQGNLDEAMRLALSAVQSDPRNIAFRLNASEVRMARKELTAAVSVLETTAKLAQKPEEKARVEARLAEVRSYQQQVAEAERMQAQASAPKEREVPGGVTQTALLHTEPPATARDTQGHVLHLTKLVEPDHKFPDAPVQGPKHTVTGKIRQVACFAPKGLLLTIEGVSKTVPLYSNDMYGIQYTAGNFTPRDVLNPCLDFDGLKATVTYGAVEDPTVKGQIVSMELNH